MKKNFDFFLDFSEFENLNTIPTHNSNHAAISIANKRNSPSPKYTFKTFQFDCITSKDQKIVLETFLQIYSQKNQYLHAYKGISFLFQSKYNPTFSMKNISSSTLSDLIQNSKIRTSWTIFDMLNCLFAVAEGLSYLHDKLIIHGNLCPSNILVDQANQSYVCDFGLYPLKKLYLNPENMANNDYKDPLMGNSEPNFKNDVYSYGILLCQLCLIFYFPLNSLSLHDFIASQDENKFKYFPKFFTNLIMSCLSPHDRPSFKQIVNYFQTSRDKIDKCYIKDLYRNFIGSNYIFNLASLGDSFALNKLGKMYEYGKNVEKNMEKALLNFEKAAQKNNSEAKSNYGILLLENPNKTSEDKVKGIKYLKESAEQGNIHGMLYYGIALKKGDGVDADIDKALEYMKKSADLGYSYAQANYGYSLLRNNPTNDQIKEGLKYIKKSMNQNNAYAFYVYGFVLKHGISVEKDVKLAQNYIKIAADMGYEDAIIENLNGDLKDLSAKKNKETSIKYFNLISDKGKSVTKKKPTSLVTNEKTDQQNALPTNVQSKSPTTEDTSGYSLSSSSSSSSLSFDSSSEEETNQSLQEDPSSQKTPDNSSASTSTVSAKSNKLSGSQSEKTIISDISKPKSSVTTNSSPSSTTPAAKAPTAVATTNKNNSPQLPQQQTDLVKANIQNKTTSKKSPPIQYTNAPMQYSQHLFNPYFNIQNIQMISNAYFAQMNAQSNNQAYMNTPTLYPNQIPNQQQVNQNTKQQTSAPVVNKEKETEMLLAEFKRMKDQYESLSKNDIQHGKRTKYDIFKKEEAFIQTNNPAVIYKYAKFYEKFDRKEDKDKSIRYYKTAADLGDGKAQAWLGVTLQDGKDLDKDLKLGFSYLEKSANQGCLNGLVNYGLALYNGEGTKKNRKLGLKYIKEAADKGNSFAQLNYGNLADDPVLGHQYIEKLANANYGEAIACYAYDFMDGRGVEKDMKKAAEILQNLYDAENDTNHLIKLIECLKEVDVKKALHYTQILANLKDKEFQNSIRHAQLYYGIELIKGQNIPQNFEEGKSYINKSNLIQELRKDYPEVFALLPHDFSSVKKRVDLFLNRNETVDPYEVSLIQSAYNGNIDDTLKAAKMIDQSGDFRTALFFYEIAADSNQKEATFILADYYLDGNSILRSNKTKGEKYVKKASELGHSRSRFEIIKPKIKQNKKMKYDKLKTFMKEINEIAKNNFIPGILLKVQYLIHTESFNEAEKELDNALSLSQQDTKFQYKIGKLMISIPNKSDKGYQILQSCSENEPKASYLLGKYYAEKEHKTLEDMTLAEKYLSKASSNKIKDSRRLLISIKKDISSYKQQIQTTQPSETQQINRKENEKSVEKIPTNLHTHEKKEPKKEKKQQEQPKIIQEQQNINDEDLYINEDLPTNELIKEGDDFLTKKNFADAFQCYEIAVKRGDPVAYFKMAKICQDFNRKLEYYQNAIINNVEGAFSEWRKCIVEYTFNHHNSDHKYAQLLEEYNDYSDASILYKRIRNKEKYEYCYNLAKERLDDIKDGNQQFDFAKLLEMNNETDLAIIMYKKAKENGIHQADKKINELYRNNLRHIQHLEKADSLVEQGICYFEGKNGIIRDFEKAVNLFKEASQIGNSKADYYLGAYYKSEFNKIEDKNKCAKYFKRSADANDPDGQNGFGDCLKEGIGVERDIDKAIYYYKLSADQGNANGEYNYGREVYLRSTNTEDRDYATSYLQKAAEKLPDAMYFYSKVIRKINPQESEKYLKMSIDRGSEYAIKDHGKILIRNNRFLEAAQLYKNAAQKGMKIGFRKYASCIQKCYVQEEDQNNEVLIDYLKKAAQFGDKKDQFNYAEFLFLQDEAADERARYFQKSAKQGHLKAYFRYAECLEEGCGVDKNLEKAKKYYTLSYLKDKDSPTLKILDRLRRQNLIDC